MIPGTEEAWDSGQLGRDEEFVEKVELDEQRIDEALELKAISIRMQKSLVDDLKLIAQVRGLGYQPLIKQVLRRFVDAEKKLLLQEAARQASEGSSKDEESVEESHMKIQCA